MEDKSACQLSRCWELFSASLSKTLTKQQKMQSQLWPNSQNWNLIIGLDAYWIDKHARQLLRRFELIWPPLSPTLSKPHERVSLSSSFLEFNFDDKFGCSFDEQVCKQTFERFQNIFTPFKHNLSKTAQQSFTFD